MLTTGSPLGGQEEERGATLKGGQGVGPWSFLQEEEGAGHESHGVQQLLGFSSIFV